MTQGQKRQTEPMEIQKTMVLIVVILLLVGCSGSAAEPTNPPTSVPLSLTPSPVLPTDTPTPEPIDCTLECNLVKIKLSTERDVKILSITGLVSSGSDEFEMDGLQVEISCELGAASQRGERPATIGSEEIIVSIDEERTYADTQHTYTIVGGFTYEQPSFNIITYDLSVTGGVFGETPQNCTMP